MKTTDMEEMSFWDHLDALRGVLFRSALAVFILAAAFFYFINPLFDTVILGPCHPDFYFYRWLQSVAEYLPLDKLGFKIEPLKVNMQNTQLAAQFFTAMSTSFWMGLVFAFPFVIFQFWSFISPALYEHEKKNIRWAFLFGNLMFFVGVFIGYSVVFPLTLRFLAGYQVSPDIPNIITLDSYMSNFLTLIFIMGIVFELPLLCWMLSGMGLLRRSFFSKYRRYAAVILLVAAAMITPSGDPFTLAVVFLPIYLLYEFSALFVKKDKPEEEDETDIIKV